VKSGRDYGGLRGLEASIFNAEVSEDESNSYIIIYKDFRFRTVLQRHTLTKII
jgi:hypothetical protein